MMEGMQPIYWDHFDVAEPEEEEWSVETRLLQKHSPYQNDEPYEEFEAKPTSRLNRLKFWHENHADEQELVRLIAKSPTNYSHFNAWSEPEIAWHWMGLALLITSFGAVSSLGVAFNLQTGVSPVLKLFWKVSGSCFVTFFLAAFSIRNHGWPEIHNRLDTALRIFACALGYTIWNASFNWALDHTSVGHVYILNNCHSLLLVLGKAFTAQPVDLFEAVGTLIGISGSVLTAMDHPLDSTHRAGAPSLNGDLGALVGAVGAVLYLVQAKVLRSRMDLMVFMWLHTFTVCLLLLPTMVLLGETFELSFDPSIGLLGWATSQWNRWPLELYLVGVCDFLGGMGYIRVMEYFEPIVVSITMLMEPVVATLLGMAVGIADLPGALTCAGSVIVIFGTIMVYSAKTKKTPQPVPSAIKRFAPRKPVGYGAVVV